MKATLQAGIRTIHVTELPPDHGHGLTEVTITVNHTGNRPHGVALDHVIMPAIVAALNVDNLEPRASVKARQEAADKWADWYFPMTSRNEPMKALLVILGTKTTRDYLAERDPMALKQCQQAVSGQSYINFLLEPQPC